MNASRPALEACNFSEHTEVRPLPTTEGTRSGGPVKLLKGRSVCCLISSFFTGLASHLLQFACRSGVK
jgi:hypothetical protein